ncbi:hypothetical protein ACFXA3_00525 [Streptomyces sp. NPDC059456]|uniref:hypothetical protein n=1 Tax=Streptomyces sp. NPDC059456 TaxID=3346838 RepID=UPI0036765D2C
MDADIRLAEPPLAPGACCDTAPCTCQPVPQDRLAEIRARAQAATKGPWEVEDDRESLTRWVVSETGFLSANLGYVGNANQDDAKFIAAARDDIPWLLAEIDRLRKENADLEVGLGLSETA